MRLLKILEGRGVQKQPQSSRNQPNSAQAKGGMAMSNILKYKSVKGLCLFLVVTVFFTTCPVPIGKACAPDPCTGNNEDCCPNKSDPTYIRNGDMNYSEIDLLIQGRGNTWLSFERVYLSRNNNPGKFGYGWNIITYGFKLHENANGDIVKYKPEDNFSYVYSKDVSGYKSPPNSPYTLVKNQDNTFTMTHNNGGQYNFSTVDGNGDARLLNIKDANNNQITLYYDAVNKLTKVTDPSNRSLELSYDSTAGLLTGLKDPNNRTFSYTYTNNGVEYDLTTAQDPNGNSVTYYYDASHNMTARVDKEGKTTTFAYDASDRCTNSNGYSLSYNPSLLKTAIIDRNGYTTDWYYIESGTLDLQTDPYGNSIDYEYYTDPTSEKDYLKLKSLADKNSNTTTYAYDVNKNLTQVVVPSGYTTIYKYDTSHNLTLETNPRGFTTAYLFDANHNRTKITDANNNNVVYQYDTYGHITGLANQDSYTTNFEFDTYGNETRQIDALSRAIKLDYDTLGNLTRSIDQDNNTTSYLYDNLNRITKVTDPSNSVTTLSYDRNGNVTRHIDSNSNTTTYNYDSENRRTKIIDPASQTITMSYDSSGNRTSIIDKTSKTTRYTYDSLNRITKATEPGGEITKFSYDKVGNLTTTIDPNNKTTNYSYDKENRITKEINPSNNSTIYAYDQNSNLTQLIDTANKTTKYTYDKLNRLTRKTDALSQNTDYVYNGVGRITKLIDPGNQTTTYTYDAVGSLTLTTLPDGITLNLGYDSLNRRTKLVDDYGTSTWAYDNLSRITRKIYPDGATFKYYYDSLGNRTKLTNADNNDFVYSYDQNSRITKLINPYSQTTSISYNANGQLTQLNYSNGTKAIYSYDTNGRVTSLANRKSDNSTIETYAYLYDASGNRTKVTFSNGDYITYLYDGTNQLTRETRKNSTNVIEYDYSYVYDAIGNRTSIDDTNFSDNFNRSDSTNLGSGWSEVVGNWEILSNRLSIPDASDNAVCIWTGGDFINPSIEAIMNAETAGTPRRSGIIVSYQSSSDFYYAGAYPQSNKWVIGRHQNGVWTDSTTLTETINKNQDYQLRTEVSGTTVKLYVKESGSWTQKLTYDFGTLPAGDVGITVEQSHTKFDNFKVGGGFDAVYEYNSVNQLTKSVKGGTTRTYTYDARGNLTRKIQGSSTTNYYFDNQNQLTKVITSSATVAYNYSDGKRVKRTKGTDTTKYYYDDFRVLVEKDSTGTVATYTTLPIDTGYILSDRRGTTDVWYHTNTIGTINNLTNSQEGVILTVESDAFGNIQSKTGTGSTNYHLTTKELDPDIELYYFIARWYDPVEGRFISQDPVPELNLYWYVKNNPTNYIDPLGNECIRLIAIPIKWKREQVDKVINTPLWVLEHAEVSEPEENGGMFWAVLQCFWGRELTIERTITTTITLRIKEFCCVCHSFLGLDCWFQTSEGTAVEESETIFNKRETMMTGANVISAALPFMRCLTDFNPN